MNLGKKYYIFSLLIILLISLYPIILYAEDNKLITEYSKRPNLIIYQVINNGADKVVNDLISNKKIWFDVLNNISRGSEEWIRVAVFLREGTDAGNATELCDAVNDALVTSPKNVLSIAIPVFQIWEICGHTPLNTYDLSIKNLEDQIKSLKNIKEPMLSSIAEACIKKLESNRLGLKQYFEVE